MNTKIIKLDINRRLYDKIVAKQDDTKSRFLLFQLLDGAVPFNLTDRSVRVYGVKPDGAVIFNDLTVTHSTTGFCLLELTNQMLAIVGTVKLELMITEGDKKLTSIPFDMEVIKKINSNDAVESSNEFRALLNALKEIDEWNKEFADKSGKLEELYTPRLNELGSQLETKVSFKIPTATNMAWAWFEASTLSDVYGGAVVKVSIREKAYSRGIEIYNQSGVTDGTQTPLDKARESFVIHHYNDNNVIQLDNVGRGNCILILKNARNNVMSGHNKTGSGDYIRFLRDDETEGIEYLGAIVPVNWKDKNITVEDKWGLEIKNRYEENYTKVPLLITSEGNSVNSGEQALYLYSLAYGGSCLKMTNSTNSKGFNLHIVANSKELNSGGILIENSGSTASIDILNQNRQVPMIRFRRTTAVYDDLIYAVNERNQPIFKIGGNGKSIFITDSGDNTLKEVKVVNGVLTVV